MNVSNSSASVNYKNPRGSNAGAENTCRGGWPLVRLMEKRTRPCGCPSPRQGPRSRRFRRGEEARKQASRHISPTACSGAAPLRALRICVGSSPRLPAGRAVRPGRECRLDSRPGGRCNSRSAGHQKSPAGRPPLWRGGRFPRLAPRVAVFANAPGPPAHPAPRP
jgi:hypothetical protein